MRSDRVMFCIMHNGAARHAAGRGGISRSFMAGQGGTGPVCQLALDTDLAAREFSEPLCNRESRPDPPVLPGGFIPVPDIKWQKDGLSGLTGHADAVIPDRNIMVFLILPV
jgi:hypothetical protein